MKKNLYGIAALTLLGIFSFSFISCSKEDVRNTETQSNVAKTANNPGHFITIDSKTIYGEEITNSVYKENELTLVNVMATWCGPCVKELPELQQIHQENNGFGVVGVVVDTFDEVSGATIETAVNEAKNIAEKTGAKYPLTIPTKTFLQQTLKKSAALLPMSFIVDKEGKIVKGPIAGAKNKTQWLNILTSVQESLN